jgi:D-psicose/D-tagatose/L-ribulose 3-epimerase
VLEANQHIRHLHVANPHGRVFPLSWNEFDYGPFFANLRKISYDKRISVEASTKDLPDEAPKAIGLLRKAFAM